MISLRRTGPRSVRARVTAGAVALLALVLFAALAVLAVLVQEAVERDTAEEAANAAQRTVDHISEDTYTDPIPTREPIVRVQVVDEGGRVLAASAALQGEPPLSTVRPPRGEFQVTTTECGHAEGPGGCLTVVGFHLSDSAYGEVMVYAAAVKPGFLFPGALELMLVLIGLVLLAVFGWIIWYGVGRTLAPVEDIRAELARISASDLHRRLPVPGTGDEVADLARTANDTLDRLEDAMSRQRRFVSDASHELRNPIAGLRARLEVELASPEPDPDAQRAALSGALADTERLQNIVNDLLELARTDAGASGTPARVDLCALVQSELGAQPVHTGLRIRAAGPAVVLGDRLRLARLLDNLLANAQRHARSRVDVIVGRDRDEVLLEVHDDGHGVAEADRERIFERFARLAESRERDPGGSGLGLAICRGIARSHGGSLEVDRSEHLGGARFVLRLPRAGAPS